MAKKTTNSSSPVSPKTRLVLWTRAAGRCQYSGCNQLLLGDIISGHETLNRAYVAHIVAIDPNGPRGDALRSPQLANDVSNLMLLCDPHHRLIDITDVSGHPENRLLSMKSEHELRIATLTGLIENRQTHLLLYAAKVGQHDCPARSELAKLAVLPERYPINSIELNLSGCAFEDHEAGFWNFQPENLTRQFNNRVKQHLANGEIKHISIFALAPQPLLIHLGRLLSDIPSADVHQLAREPQTWRWRDDGANIEFEVTEGDGAGSVALKLALSATVNDDRIKAVLGGHVAIWSIVAKWPGPDILRRRTDLAVFRTLLREVFNRIKSRHGEVGPIHVFPALPVAAAVEVGRVWMPKSDLPLVIYDNERHQGGFIPRMNIGEQGVSDRG